MNYEKTQSAESIIAAGVHPPLMKKSIKTLFSLTGTNQVNGACELNPK